MQHTIPQKELFNGSRPFISATYKQQAYALIKEAILYRRIKPGEFYSQDGLCAQFGISRTPVREALLELQQEGYIQFLRGKGIAVATLSTQESTSIMELRYYSEALSARLAARRITESGIAQLRLGLERLKELSSTAEWVTWYREDRQFHRILLEASENVRLLKQVEELRDRYMCADSSFLNDLSFEQRLLVCEEHKKILDGILTRNPDTAERVMKEHLQQSYLRNVGYNVIEI